MVKEEKCEGTTTNTPMVAIVFGLLSILMGIIINLITTSTPQFIIGFFIGIGIGSIIYGLVLLIKR